MPSIPSLASKTIALSLLSGIRGKDAAGTEAQEETLGKPAGPWATATGLSPVLSSKVRAELMKAGQVGDKDSLLYNFRADGEQTSYGDPLFDRVSRLQFSIRSTDIPAEDLARLEGTADTFVRLSTPQLAQKDFEEFILHYQQKRADLDDPAYEGFKEALANGTLKIQRSVDVNGLNYDSHYYDMYRDGHRVGTQGWGTENKDFVRSVQAQGLKVAMGSAWGQAFFITWPDPAAKTA